MHIQTHILSGWCVGNLLPFNSRQRLACMIAASIADLDGLGRVVPGRVGQELFWKYHHTLGHNLPFAILVASGLAVWCRRQPVLTWTVCLLLFHLHLLMDYWGSGPDWHIHYLWPLQYVWPSAVLILKNPRSWELYSWQNLLAFGLLLVWTIGIVYWNKRTPLEAIMPRLDGEIVKAMWRKHAGGVKS